MSAAVADYLLQRFVEWAINRTSGKTDANSIWDALHKASQNNMVDGVSKSNVVYKGTHIHKESVMRALKNLGNNANNGSSSSITGPNSYGIIELKDRKFQDILYSYLTSDDRLSTNYTFSSFTRDIKPAVKRVMANGGKATDKIPSVFQQQQQNHLDNHNHNESSQILVIPGHVGGAISGQAQQYISAQNSNLSQNNSNISGKVPPLRIPQSNQSRSSVVINSNTSESNVQYSQNPSNNNRMILTPSQMKPDSNHHHVVVTAQSAPQSDDIDSPPFLLSQPWRKPPTGPTNLLNASKKSVKSSGYGINRGPSPRGTGNSVKNENQNLKSIIGGPGKGNNNSRNASPRGPYQGKSNTNGQIRGRSVTPNGSKKTVTVVHSDQYHSSNKIQQTGKQTTSQNQDPKINSMQSTFTANSELPLESCSGDTPRQSNQDIDQLNDPVPMPRISFQSARSGLLSSTISSQSRARSTSNNAVNSRQKSTSPNQQQMAHVNDNGAVVNTISHTNTQNSECDQSTNLSHTNNNQQYGSICAEFSQQHVNDIIHQNLTLNLGNSQNSPSYPSIVETVFHSGNESRPLSVAVTPMETINNGQANPASPKSPQFGPKSVNENINVNEYQNYPDLTNLNQIDNDALIHDPTAYMMNLLVNNDSNTNLQGSHNLMGSTVASGSSKVPSFSNLHQFNGGSGPQIQNQNLLAAEQREFGNGNMGNNMLFYSGANENEIQQPIQSGTAEQNNNTSIHNEQQFSTELTQYDEQYHIDHKLQHFAQPPQVHASYQGHFKSQSENNSFSQNVVDSSCVIMDNNDNNGTVNPDSELRSPPDVLLVNTSSLENLLIPHHTNTQNTQIQPQQQQNHIIQINHEVPVDQLNESQLFSYTDSEGQAPGQSPTASKTTSRIQSKINTIKQAEKEKFILQKEIIELKQQIAEAEVCQQQNQNDNIINSGNGFNLDSGIDDASETAQYYERLRLEHEKNCQMVELLKKQIEMEEKQRNHQSQLSNKFNKLEANIQNEKHQQSTYGLDNLDEISKLNPVESGDSLMDLRQSLANLKNEDSNQFSTNADQFPKAMNQDPNTLTGYPSELSQIQSAEPSYANKYVPVFTSNLNGSQSFNDETLMMSEGDLWRKRRDSIQKQDTQTQTSRTRFPLPVSHESDPVDNTQQQQILDSDDQIKDPKQSSLSSSSTIQNSNSVSSSSNMDNDVIKLHQNQDSSCSSSSSAAEQHSGERMMPMSDFVQNQDVNVITNQNQCLNESNIITNNKFIDNSPKPRQPSQTDSEYIIYLEQILAKVVNQNKFLSNTVDELMDFINVHVTSKNNQTNEVESGKTERGTTHTADIVPMEHIYDESKSAQ